MSSTISIHAPRKGSDFGFTPNTELVQISIHAPRKGSDGYNGLHFIHRVDFNPRSP